jgi:hypothetical protein
LMQCKLPKPYVPLLLVVQRGPALTGRNRTSRGLACLLPCHPGARCSGGCVDGQRNESRQNQTSIHSRQ